MQFAYTAPNITRVQGCPDNTNVATSQCPVGGSTVITIHGTSFGVPGDAAVLIDGQPCLNLEHAVNHTQLRCESPVGRGFNLAVRVTVAGQFSERAWLSYTGPELHGLRLVSGNAVSRFNGIELNDTLGGQVIELAARNLGANVSAVSVTYGTAGNPSRYRCTVDAAHTNATAVRCTMAAGVGSNLVFRVSVDNQLVGAQQSQASAQTVSYPNPVIVPNTIRSLTGLPSNELQGTNTEGQYIIFGALNLGPDPDAIAVTFGPAAGAKTQQCTDVSFPSAGLLQCRSGSGVGGPYVFVVTALDAASAPGTDTYSYPVAPVVYTVLGCPQQNGNATAGCTTQGESHFCSCIG